MNKPLTIAILAQGGREWVGGAELTKNLVQATLQFCVRENKPVRFKIIGDRDKAIDNTSGLSNTESIEWLAYPSSRRTIANRLLNRMGYRHHGADLKKLLRSHRIDFFYPSSFPSEEIPCRSAAWIYDFQHKRMPEMFSLEELAHRDRAFEALAKNASTVVVSSEAARNDFFEFLPDYSHKVVALPFRVVIPEKCYKPSPIDSASKLCLPEKFFIVCNQFWIHKNHRTVLEATALAAKLHPDLTVVMTGRMSDHRNPGYADELLSMIQEKRIHSNVRLLGLVPKEVQLSLLHLSIAVIQPSLFEGWSTIVEECHAFGKHVLLSDIAVHREQATPEAWFFNPGDPRALAELMIRAWHAPANTSNNTDYNRLVLEFGQKFYALAHNDFA